jgi:hypothetical protein
VIPNEIVAREERFPINGDIRLTNDQRDHAEMIVIDISRSGVGIDGLMHFPEETPVRVDFPNGKMRTGRTKWRDTFTSGVAFDTPMTDGELCALWTALRNQPHFPAKVRAANG